MAEEFWLWPEGDAVCWWSTRGTGRCHRARPGPQFDLSRLREGFDRPDLRTTLRSAPELANALTAALACELPVRLRLSNRFADPGQPEAVDWARVPFEWMRMDSRPLHGRLSVERFVSADAVDPPPPLRAGSVRVCVRLSKGEDGAFVHAFRKAGGIEGVLSTLGLGLHHEDTSGTVLAQLDPAQHSALVLVCHGTEGKDSRPFRLPDESSWDLPLAKMPPLLVLLVCGSDAGNLLAYARDALVGGGAGRAIVAPVGKLGLEEAARFLRHFLIGWATGKPVHEIVREAQDAEARESENEATYSLDARRLCVLGQGELRLAMDSANQPTIAVHKLPQAELIERARAEVQGGSDGVALIELVRRTTLHCMLAGRVDRCWEQFCKALGEIAPTTLRATLEAGITRAWAGDANALDRVSVPWVEREVRPTEYIKHLKAGAYAAVNAALPYFPPEGAPGRELPKFAASELPAPLAEAWAVVNQQINQQEVYAAARQLKEAFGTTVAFMAAVAAIDALRAPSAAPVRKTELAQRLFGQGRSLLLGDWLDCLSLALRLDGIERRLPKLRHGFIDEWGLFIPTWQFLADECVSWQQRAEDFDKCAVRTLAIELRDTWLPRLRLLLEELTVMLSGWQLADTVEHRIWHGMPPPAGIAHDHHPAMEVVPLVLQHKEEGLTLDLAPLVSLQYCRKCSRGAVFLFQQRRAEASAKFVDARLHDNDRVPVPALMEVANGVHGITGGDEEARWRGEEERLLFEHFDKAEFVRPDYLFASLWRERKGLADKRRGYIHLLGPAGCGKSWFARRLAEEHQENRYAKVLRYRLSALGPSGAAGFLDALADQAHEQMLGGVDGALEQAKLATGYEQQFVTFLSALRSANPVITSLTVVLDGLDELVVPEPPRPRRIEPVLLSVAGDGESLEPVEPNELEMPQASVVTSLDFLPAAAQLPEGCVVLLVSRETMGEPARACLERLNAHGRVIEWRLDPQTQAHREVMATYIGRALRGGSDGGVFPATLEASILERSGGIFLYVHHLVQVIKEGTFSAWDVLPQGAAFYTAYLSKLRKQFGADFEPIYLRVLLLLTAAEEPVPLELLARWGVPLEHARRAVLVLRHFLTEKRPPGDGSASGRAPRYQLAHGDFWRYLLQEPILRDHYYEAEAEIIEHLLNLFCSVTGDVDFDDVEVRYAIRNFRSHARRKPLRFDRARAREFLLGASKLVTRLSKEKTAAAGSMLADIAACLMGFVDSVMALKESWELRIPLDRRKGNLRKAQLYEFGLASFTLATSVLGGLVLEGRRNLRNELVSALFGRANALLQLSRAEEAVAEYTAAIALCRERIAEGNSEARYDVVRALHGRADAQRNRGHDSEALTDYSAEIAMGRELMIERAPTEARRWPSTWTISDAFESRAGIMHKLGRYEEAVAEYAAAISLYQELLIAWNGVKSDYPNLKWLLGDTFVKRANRLRELGRYEEALADYSATIALCSERYAKGASYVLHDIKSAFHARVEVLRKLGRNDEAQAESEAELALYGDLLRGGRTETRRDDRSALRARADAFLELGRGEEALADYSTEIALCRERMNEGDSDVRYDLGSALHRRANALRELGHEDEALADYSAEIAIVRELMIGHRRGWRDSWSYRFLLDVAFENRAQIMHKLGRHEEALAEYTAEISLYRELLTVWTGESKYLKGKLGDKFAKRARKLREFDRSEEALADYAAAIALRRELVAEGKGESRSDEYRELESTLDDWIELLHELGRDDEALAEYATQNALLRKLVTEGNHDERNHDELLDLASMVGKRATLLRELGRYEEAIAQYATLAALLRKSMNEGNVAAWIDLGLALRTRAMLLIDADRQEEALAEYAAEIALYRELSSGGKTDARRDLASALRRRAEFLCRLGRNEEALPEYTAEIVVWHEQIADGWQSMRTNLASALGRRAEVLLGIGSDEEALADYAAQIALCRELVTEGNRDAYHALVKVLDRRADALDKSGLVEEAIKDLEEARVLRASMRPAQK